MINSDVLAILYLVAGVLVFLLVLLIWYYFRMQKKETEELEKPKKIEESDEKKDSKNSFKTYKVCSVMDFMDFEAIEDNMIVQKKGRKYTMVIECQGINYYLMSDQEQVAVEEGFVQFLNALQTKVQLYIQTRTINLEESLRNYKEKLDVIEKDLNRQKAQYQQLVVKGASDSEIKREYYELVKKQNLYEYGQDVIQNTERMSLNKNMLTKKYYVVVPYYTAELEEGNLDKGELKDRAFSELYTRCQSIIRSLSVSGVNGKILSSVELADLLYVSYNRDDSEIFGIDKAIKSQYDSLYTTAPDLMEKKMKILDDDIERQANRLVNQKIVQAKSQIERKYEEKQRDMDDLVANLAQLIITQNESAIGYDVAQSARESIDEDRQKREEEKNVQKNPGKINSSRA